MPLLSNYLKSVSACPNLFQVQIQFTNHPFVVGKKVSCEFSGVFARPFSVTAISGLQSISANKIVIAKASHN